MPALSKLYTKREIDEIRRALILVHGDKCAICKKPRTAFKNNLAVDHNHKSGQVRGLLCYRCNKFLVGRASIETATKVLEYLMYYDKPEELK